ncbi:VanZ family protein [Corynebacterium sp. TAE3-ERU30]|uniref:VanZ family protein n=1 Tax=Corynebacterium sp. TAE3-ERU30 TaxID=2849496 RepID=UPI001C49092E|nr:VanZ family protein [Corynebacterium sp. TAE3-ERU30]MBV7282359.1 VanZ family protein [Corynebacterium sp. TAE3-ERU30]
MTASESSAQGAQAVQPARPSGPRPGLVWAALICQLVTIAAATLLKSVFVIGHLWRREAHRHRGVELMPLDDFWNAQSVVGSLLNVAGNVALFAPLGFVLVLLLRGRAHPVRTATLLSLALSLGIELAQYVFRLGYSDIDDLLYNTLGAALGAWLVTVSPPIVQRLALALCLLFMLTLMLLYALGSRLGSPDAVVASLGCWVH